jgi:LysM repeat protein
MDSHLSSGRHLPAAAKFGLRLASVVALATGGIALGRGVVSFVGARGQVVDVAGASRADESAALPSVAVDRGAPPTFASSIRSWAAPAPVPTAAAQSTPAVAAPVPAERSETSELYTVAAGDTLSQIAERYAVGVNVLAAANQLTDANVLRPGAQLRIPAGVAGSPVILSTAAQAVPAAPEASSSAPGAATPDAAVRSFYALIEQGKLDQAAGLWSQRMRSAYPPAENIVSRFARTQALTVSRSDVVQLDAANGRATVAVCVQEVVGPAPSATRQYVGNWYLVRGPGGWLLDQPSLQAS